MALPVENGTVHGVSSRDCEKRESSTATFCLVLGKHARALSSIIRHPSFPQVAHANHRPLVRGHALECHVAEHPCLHLVLASIDHRAGSVGVRHIAAVIAGGRGSHQHLCLQERLRLLLRHGNSVPAGLIDPPLSVPDDVLVVEVVLIKCIQVLDRKESETRTTSQYNVPAHARHKITATSQ
eukprot:2102442-Rhodomonas_salina.3